MLDRTIPLLLDQEQIGYYYDAIKTDEHCGGPDVVSNMINSGQMQLWLWEDEDSICVVITQLNDSPDGYRQLVVSMMAGRNIIRNGKYEQIHRGIFHEALSQGVDRMIAFVKPEIWENLSRAGANYKEEYVVISLDKEEVLDELVGVDNE